MGVGWGKPANDPDRAKRRLSCHMTLQTMTHRRFAIGGVC